MASPRERTDDLLSLLWIIGRCRPDRYIEVRYPLGRGMQQEWHRAGNGLAILSALAPPRNNGDVFIGAAPRNARRGGREAVSEVYSLWADCDTPEALSALAEFHPEPSYIVATGSEDNVQAWWPLRDPVAPELAERLNRTLATALGADSKATDCARILRPPGTFNHKHCPAAPTRCLANVPGFTELADITRHGDGEAAHATRQDRPATSPRDDILLAIPAREYIPKLTGREVDSNGKVQCPLHASGNERTPSLHAYAIPNKGWHCYGCDQGGSIYDFGAALWGLDTRGQDFRTLRGRLVEALGV